MKLENAPALELDKTLYARTPMPPHVVRERRIVWNFLKHMEARGITPTFVNDGEEQTRTVTKKAVMEVLFNLDEAHVFFSKKITPTGKARQGWVFFVLGNDLEIISDYTVNLDPEVSQFRPEAFA